MNGTERRKSRVFELMEQYYESPSKMEVIAGSGTAADKIGRKNLRELKNEQKIVGKEIASLRKTKNQCLFDTFSVLTHKYTAGPLLEDALLKSVAGLENHWTEGLKAKWEFLPESALSKRHELIVVAHLESLIGIPDLVERRLLEEDVRKALSLLECVLGQLPDSLMKFRLIANVVSKLHEFCHQIVHKTVCEIEAGFHITVLREKMGILQQAINLCPNPEEVSKSAICRILEARESAIVAQLDQVSPEIIKGDMASSFEEIIWMFPASLNSVLASDNRIFSACLSHIQNMTDVSRFKTLFSESSSPTYSEAIRMGFIRSVGPRINELISQEDLREFGSKCAEYLTTDPRDEVVIIFESIVIDELNRLANDLKDWESILRLFSLQEWFHTNVVIKLRRMVSNEMIGESVSDRQPDVRLFCLGLNLWTQTVMEMLDNDMQDEAHAVVEKLEPWRSTLFSLPSEATTTLRIIGKRLPSTVIDAFLANVHSN